MQAHQQMRKVLGTVVLVLAVACTGPEALPQLRAYDAAVQQTSVASGRLLDELSVAERKLLQDQAGKPGPTAPLGVDELFDPKKATIFATEADPPLTHAYRRALEVVASYNSALIALAEGRGLETLQADAGRLADELAGIAELAGIGASAVPGLGATLPALRLAIDEAAKAASRAAFREAFLREYSVVDGILVAMRDGTADVFPILTRSNLALLRRARIENAPPGIRAALAARHEAWRAALSDWVVLIDETRAAMAAVRARLNSPEVQLADIADRSAQLRALAGAIRLSLVRARSDVQP